MIRAAVDIYKKQSIESDKQQKQQISQPEIQVKDAKLVQKEKLELEKTNKDLSQKIDKEIKSEKQLIE